MDESIQKAIERSLTEKPEHWVWDFGGKLCAACIKNVGQSLQKCVAGHTTRSGARSRGGPILYPPLQQDSAET